MNGSPSFSDLLAPPGSSAPASPQPATGGTMLNDRAKQAALSSPLQQARVAVEQSKQALMGLAQKFAEADNVQ